MICLIVGGRFDGEFREVPDIRLRHNEVIEVEDKPSSSSLDFDPNVPGPETYTFRRQLYRATKYVTEYEYAIYVLRPDGTSPQWLLEALVNGYKPTPKGT